MIQPGYTNRLIKVVNDMRDEANSVRESNALLAEKIDFWADCVVKALFKIGDEQPSA